MLKLATAFLAVIALLFLTSAVEGSPTPDDRRPSPKHCKFLCPDRDLRGTQLQQVSTDRHTIKCDYKKAVCKYDADTGELVRRDNFWVCPPKARRVCFDDRKDDGHHDDGHGKGGKDDHKDNKDDRHKGNDDNHKGNDDRHKGGKDDDHKGKKDDGHGGKKDDGHGGGKDGHGKDEKDHKWD